MTAMIVVFPIVIGLSAGGGSARAQALSTSPTTAVPEAPADEYVIAVQDSVNVTVWENADLTGKFIGQPDGAIMLPLVGRVKAAGLSVRGFEAQLTSALADGFLIEPRVAVTLAQHRAGGAARASGLAAPPATPPGRRPSSPGRSVPRRGRRCRITPATRK